MMVRVWGLFLSAAGLICCSTTDQFKSTEIFPSPVTPQTQVFTLYAPYGEVWKAAEDEMSRFPLKISNKNAGVIVSDNIREFAGIINDNTKDVRRQIVSYYEVRITPLDTGLNPRTKVEVTRFISKVGDYGDSYSSPLSSDGVQEKVILYRIKRLIELERKVLEKSRAKGI